MERDWEGRLHEYVSRMNQAVLLCSTAPLSSCVDDGEFMGIQQARLRNMKKSLEERNAWVVRCTTRLKVISAAQSRNKVEAELRLHRERIVGSGKGRVLEQWVEQERVTLEKRGGIWTIRTVVPFVPEKAKFSKKQALHEGEAELGELLINGEAPFSAFQELADTQKEREILPRAALYDRMKARDYADRWWNGSNPDFPVLKVDCTNYVSQCLFAGGVPLNYTGKRNSGWWFRKTAGGHFDWSFSWAVSNILENYLRSRKGLRASPVERPEMLRIGDVIFYDWDGDGAFQHTALVTDLDFNGMPLVNAHTINSRKRYWDYRDSYAWSERTRYRFYRIADRQE